MDFRKDAKRISLNREWKMAFGFGEDMNPFMDLKKLHESDLPVYMAQVPGNFELDLHRNGLIPEPFFGMNIASLTEYEHAHVWYWTEFDLPEEDADNAFLEFEGIDVGCRVTINGEFGNQRNPQDSTFQVYRYRKLKPGANSVLLCFMPRSFHFLTSAGPGQFSAYPCGYQGLGVRRPPHVYGWDIMPRAISPGIWRPVSVRYQPVEHIRHVWLDTMSISEDHSSGDLRLCYQTDIRTARQDFYDIELTGSCGESAFNHRSRMFFKDGQLRFSLDNPSLWWPKDRGEQNLYDCRVTLFKNGEEIDHMTFTHGIRTVELDRTSTTDMTGKGEFCFKVNGERLFVRGTNWVPLDAYHSRDIERVEQALELADEIGCNMIRCWGGNVYESDLFYEICDRKGILVWQDFSMACAVYPQSEMFCKTIRDEVREVVQRLRQHPCIVLWAGDNECDLAYSWGGRRQDPNRNKLTRQVIPDVLFEEDPSRPYLPSSPYIDEEAFRVGEKYITENHLWGPRDYYKSDFYTQSLCHFASEIGYHGCPSPESIRKFISPEKLWPYWDNDEWTLHCTSPIPGVDICDYRVELMAKQIRELFGTVPDNLDDFAFASQCSQAEAKKFFIEMFRLAKWWRTGIIWWNLLDGWPQFSDAVVDYYFEKKLAFDFIKRAQSPVLVAIREPNNWKQEVVICNDLREDCVVKFKVRDVDTDEVILEGQRTAKGDATAVVGSIPYTQSAQRFYTIEWSSEHGEGRSHYLAGNPPFDLERYRGWLLKAEFC